MEIDSQGWLSAVTQRPSPHQDERPANTEPDLLVIHNISLPPGCFSGEDIDALFMGVLDCSKHDFYQDLIGLRVSAHCLIRRDGSLTQYVPFSRRAWHAGRSVFQGRTCCNDFSIGIEMEGTDNSGFTCHQYNSLILLSHCLMRRYPQITLSHIVGHCDIAPGRKTDPGFGFDWAHFRATLMDIDK